MKRLVSVATTALVVVLSGCSSSSDDTANASHTGGAAGAPSGTGGSAHTGGTASTGGASSSGAVSNSGGTGAVSAGGGAPSAGRGGAGAGGTTSGGATSGGATSGGTTSSSGGAAIPDSGASDARSDAGNPGLCGSTPCTPTRCAGVGCGPAVCCEGPNGPVCIHGATECPAADGGVRSEKLQCTGGGRSGDFARSCSKDAECFVAEHWAGCCHIDAVGLNVTDRAAFTSFEASCGGPPPCGCCCDRIVTESGMSVASGSPISVRCVDGMCTTSSP